MTDEKLERITSEVIRAFIANKEAEGRALEYKEMLPSQSEDDKREFLADVSSFANAVGGDILYGITAERDGNGKSTGLPADAVGLAVASPDAELLRLDAILRDGLDPRLPRVEMKFVDGFARGPVLLIRIGQSWSAPHMVKYRGLSRFYSRSGAGKYQLDVREIRAAFGASEALPQRIRSFRDDRLAKIVSGQSPLGSAHRKMFVLHLLPLTAFAPAPTAVSHIARFETLEPLHLTERPKGPTARRYNLDGYLLSSPATAEYKPLPYAKDYVQVFRSGAVEAVASLDQIETFKDWFPEHFGAKLVDYVDHYLQSMKECGVPLPLVVMASMLGVKGTKLNVQEQRIPIEMRAASNCQYHPMEQDNVLLPDVPVEDCGTPTLEVLRPILDAIWQGCGFPRYFRDSPT